MNPWTAKLRALLAGYFASSPVVLHVDQRAVEVTLEGGATEIERLEAEVARLQKLLEPCLMDSTDREWAKSPYPPTVNDCLSLLSEFIAYCIPDEALIPNDEYFGAWEQAARPVVEKLYAEVARLQAIVDTARKATDPDQPVSVRHPHWLDLIRILWHSDTKAAEATSTEP